MRLYISSLFEKISEKPIADFVDKNIEDMYVLTSFAYWKESFTPYMERAKRFLSDSGAFTVMFSKKGQGNFNPLEYTKKYANFVKSHNIKDFIEMDIDGVYGIDVYKDCLHCLQDITGRDPVPVWHKWRGLENWYDVCKNHKFVCFGDVNNKISREGYDYFVNFLDIAHSFGTKVHGLGITGMKNLKYLSFDSVDSSTWSSGCRFAEIHKFDGHDIFRCRLSKDERRKEKDIDVQKINLNNLSEWVKLQKYLEQYESSDNDW